MLIYSIPMIASLAGALLSIMPGLYFEEAVSILAAAISTIGLRGPPLFLPDQSGGLHVYRRSVRKSCSSRSRSCT